jgi:hypothetical protein
MTERVRGNRYWVTAIWFIVGAIAGGLGLGTLACLLAIGLAQLGLTATQALAAASIFAVIGLASDVRLGGFQLPLNPRQVNETWLLRYRRWIYAAGFGVQIGCGFATYIMTGGVYVLLGLAALTGNPLIALALGAGFGTVRGVAVLFGARATTFAATQRIHRRLADLEAASKRSALVLQAAVVVAALGGAFGSTVIVATAGTALCAWVAGEIALTVRRRPNCDMMAASDAGLRTSGERAGGVGGRGEALPDLSAV